MLAVWLVSACARPALAPRAPRPGSASYSIQSYNVECGKHQDPSIIEAVGAGHADVVCLQETTPEYEAALRRRYTARYPYQLYRHNLPHPGAGGLAILSRFPVLDRGYHRAPNGWHPAWHVEVQTPSGPIQILLVHLRAKLSGRVDDLTALLTLRSDHLDEIKDFSRFTAAGRPTLVVGDFNEEADGAAVRWLEARGYQNALPLFHPGEHTWRHPILAWEFRQMLDHVLFDRAFVPLDARVIHAGHSDHLPVVARLQLAEAPRWGSLRPRIADVTGELVGGQ